MRKCVVSLCYKSQAMTYTAKQIENAKAKYNAFLTYRDDSYYQPEFIGRVEAANRAEAHNKQVDAILGGDKALEAEWKMFFLNEEVKADQKAAASKAKLAANKEASADVLAPIKAAKKIGEFGKWLNDAKNPFRKQHFTKNYTNEAVTAFLTK